LSDRSHVSRDDRGEEPQEPDEKPHPLALLILVAFPFLLMALIALLYSWLTR
jgi:hypothetical protein